MQGKWTKLYHDSFEEVKAALADELKARLKEATYEMDEEIVSQSFQDTSSAMPTRRSWFRKRLVEKYQQDQYRYKKGIQIDGFLAFILPEVQKEFDSHFKDADERTKEEIYFDKDFAEFPNYKSMFKF